MASSIRASTQDRAHLHVVEDAICSVEKLGEMLLSNMSEACLTCSHGVDSILDKNSQLSCGIGLLGNDNGPGASMRSLMHERAFPPLANVVAEREEFPGGDAQEYLALYFDDGASMSMTKFHTERGDRDVRFGRWMPLRQSQLERTRSDISRREGQRGRSQSLIGDVPAFFVSMPTLERHASFRTPVRLPAAGMTDTEVSVVQRMLHLGDVHGGLNRGRSYVIETVLRLLDVPYSDRFRVVIRTTMSTESPLRQQQAGGSFASDKDAGGSVASYRRGCGHLACAHLIRDDGDSPCSCPVPLCSPQRIEQSDGTSQQGENAPCHDSSSSAVLRVEFEIQFHRGCQFEDRIRKMLTKKITKLLKSWCSWAQVGWMEERVPSMEVAIGDGDYNDDTEVEGSSSQQKKWQSLWKCENEGDSDAMLLWSMTDLEADVDDDELRNGHFRRMEWRNRSLTESIGDDEFFEDHRGHGMDYRGHGVELCLCDDEGSSHELAMIESSQVSDCGLEVVYVTDESDEEAEKIDGRPPAQSFVRSLSGGFQIPLPLKGRSRSDDCRQRRSMFKQQQKKKMKVLEEHDDGGCDESLY